MSEYAIRPATEAEFATAVAWAAQEGWNPGVDDLSAFYSADPSGFLMGFLDGEPAAAISVVRYGENYGFLGFYIVTPQHRGRGLGMQVWNAGLAHLEGRTIGLDGVVAQQENYRKSGFALAGRNVRFTGNRPTVDEAATIHAGHVVRVTSDTIADVIDYDAAFFPADRSRFISAWASPQSPASRQAYAVIGETGLEGYGVIRVCRSGYKVGPLFADTPAIAQTLFGAMIAPLAEGVPVSIDVPEDNRDAVRLAEAAGLVPTFETARMYRGPAPELPVARTFGITTFELG
ncbi:MAG: GNAT family N-acetyltransferase [Pseudomonadota bacterium]